MGKFGWPITNHEGGWNQHGTAFYYPIQKKIYHLLLVLAINASTHILVIGVWEKREAEKRARKRRQEEAELMDSGRRRRAGGRQGGGSSERESRKAGERGEVEGRGRKARGRMARAMRASKQARLTAEKDVTLVWVTSAPRVWETLIAVHVNKIIKINI